MLFPEAKDISLKKYILGSPDFRSALDALEADRVRYLSTPAAPLPFSLFRRFFTDGDRRKYEDIYFARRGRLSAFTAAVLLYGREEDITALEDTVWDICSEYTWALPAHTQDLGDRYDTGDIDLFCAETGFALAEIYYLLSDVLDSKVTTRILENIEARIFRPYSERSFWWEDTTINWAAVCAGSIGAAYIYTAPDAFESVRGRISRTLSSFLDGFGDDGACLEGIGYWNYGFGYFTYYAQLLKEFSGGRYDLFNNAKCKKIALFQQSAFLRKNYTVSFSDGYGQYSYLPGLTQKLYDIYGDELYAPLAEYAEFDDSCHRFPAYLRNFFWAAKSTVPHKSSRCSEEFYPDAGWYILNRSRLSLAAKAGHNDEPHNHNDIGSFALFSDEGSILCDFGCGEYCREYFDPEKRYGFLCNSSRGHSVPIINGAEQRAGRSFHGEVLSAGNGMFTADISAAYDDAGLRSLTRSVSVSDENIFLLRDTFVFDSADNRVTERFVTLTEPEPSDGAILIGGHRLIYDPSYTPVIRAERLSDHHNKEVTMYLIDFELCDPAIFELKLV